MDLLAYSKYAALCPKSNGLAGRKKSCALWLVKKWVVYGAEKVKNRLALEKKSSAFRVVEWCSVLLGWRRCIQNPTAWPEEKNPAPSGW